MQPTGSKLWRLKYRFAGKEKVLALGVYGDITIRQACDGRDAARKLLSNGIDPSTERRAAKLRQAAAADGSEPPQSRRGRLVYVRRSRPHDALGRLPPKQFLHRLTATDSTNQVSP